METKTETMEAKRAYYLIPEENLRQAIDALNNLTIKGADAGKVVLIKSVLASAEREER